MISISNLGKWFGDQTLFAKVSLQLNPGERYGLVGANGSGKTTLLSILSGDQEASEGEVTVPQRLRLGVLRQDQFLYEDEKIINVALMGNAELWEVMAAKEALLAKAEEHFDAERFFRVGREGATLRRLHRRSPGGDYFRGLGSAYRGALRTAVDPVRGL